jgi:Ca-activated chloride channel homolog
MNLEIFSLGNQQNLFFLILLLPIYIWARYRYIQDRKLKASIAPALYKGVLDKENTQYALSRLTPLLLGIGFLIIALAMPRWGFEEIENTLEGVDIVIAADVSMSMLTEDISPSRLTILKRKVEDLISMFDGDRVGLISFAGVSFIEAPLTLDYGVIKLLIDSISPDLVPLQGSDLESAALGAKTAFKNMQGTSNRSKALLILSDGEFDPETLDQGMEILKKENIIPFLLAIGTEEGAPVPGPGGFKRDRESKIIFSRSQIDSLIPQFKAINGEVLRYTSTTSDLRTIYFDFIKKKLTTSAIDSDITKRWNEYFQIPLALGIIFIFFSWVIRPSSAEISLCSRFTESLRNSSKTRNVTTASLILVCTAIPFPAYTEPPRILSPALEKFNQGRFEDAYEELSDLKDKEFHSHHLYLALGNTLYRMGKFTESIREYEMAEQLAMNESERGEALFNKGNALTQLNALEYALSQYQKALEQTPHDTETKKNLAYVKKLIQNQKDKNQDESEEKDNSSSSDSSEASNENSENNEDSSPPPEKEQESTADSSSGGKDESKSESSKKEEEEEENDKGSSSSDPSTEDSNNDQEKDEEDPAPSNQTEERESSPEESQKSIAQGEETQQNEPQHEQLEQLLDGMEESTSTRSKYRYNKAMEQLKRMPRKNSNMDW